MQLRRAFLSFPIAFLIVLSVIACRPVQPTSVPSEPPRETDAPAAVHTDTASAPTPTITATTEPAAVRVNNDEISLRVYEAEMGRFQAAMDELGKTVPPDEARQRVIDAMVDETLLAQAAVQSGFEVTEEDVDTRLAQVIADLGGEELFQAWLVSNQYTRESYRQALSQSIAASWQRDQIAASVPAEIEQVHARQILVLGREQADDIHRRLQAGADFATLVLQYDAVTGGDLGWFPQGYLTVKALEEAAFNLEPGEFSQIVESEFGYHILQVLERSVQPLSPDARLMLQRQALQDWLVKQRSSSTIEIFLP